MAKPKFHFNPSTLTYDRIDNSFKHRFKNIIIHFFSSISLGLLFFVIYTFTFNSPREKDLIKENRSLKVQYNVLSKQMDGIQEVLTDIQQRDDNMYRVIYQADAIPTSVRQSGYEGTNRYANLMNTPDSEMMIEITKKMDLLSKQLYIQSLSFDEIIGLAKQNEDKLQCIPSIQPVSNKDLKRTASGYGMRIDPIYKTVKFHAGMDFSASVGSDIYATGNGTVTFTGWKQGYGNAVIINHKYGYETLYGHMDKIKIRQGAKIKRGEIIGYVGSSGKSTGPHLHYEVRYKGKPTNPQNYYFMDLSPENYDKMTQLSTNCGQVFD
jgi:murein DD-endopeptidase MepM/ murein hydrolase activator NlpD